MEVDGEADGMAVRILPLLMWRWMERLLVWLLVRIVPLLVWRWRGCAGMAVG